MSVYGIKTENAVLRSSGEISTNSSNEGHDVLWLMRRSTFDRAVFLKA